MGKILLGQKSYEMKSDLTNEKATKREPPLRLFAWINLKPPHFRCVRMRANGGSDIGLMKTLGM